MRNAEKRQQGTLNQQEDFPLSFFTPLPPARQFWALHRQRASPQPDLEAGQRPAVLPASSDESDPVSEPDAFAASASTDSEGVRYIRHRYLTAEEFVEAAIALSFDFRTTMGPAFHDELKARHKLLNSASWLLFMLTMIAYPTIFYTFEAPYLNAMLSPAVVYVPIYVFLVVWVSYLTALGLDPGAVPQGLHESPEAFLPEKDRRAQQAVALEGDLAIAAIQHDSPGRQMALLRLQRQLDRAWSSTPELRPPAETNRHSGGSASHSQRFAIVRSPSDPQISKPVLRMPRSLENVPAADDAASIDSDATLVAVPHVECGRSELLVYHGEDEQNIPAPDWMQAKPMKTVARAASKWHVPAELDLDPEAPHPSSSLATREIALRNHRLQVRWCPKCQSYPPPLAIHSPWTGRCIEACEKHTSWLLNQDLGSGNLLPWLVFLFSSCVAMAYCIAFSAWLLWDLSRWSQGPSGALRPRPPGILLSQAPYHNLRTALRANPFAGIEFLLCTFLLLGLFLPRLVSHVLYASCADTSMLRQSRRYMIIRWGIHCPYNPFSDVGRGEEHKVKTSEASWRNVYLTLFAKPAGSRVQERRSQGEFDNHIH